MKFLKVALILTISSYLVACEKPSNVSADTDKPKVQQDERKYLKEFEAWKKAQDPEKLKQYESFFSNKLKKAPTLYELTLNSHPLNKECEQYRFALPPEEQWKNLIPALQLIEKLSESKLYANYKIVSVYRSKEANECVRGAKASKHLSNFAVDFQTLNENMQHYPNDAEMDEKLCRFWHKEGKQHRLGLGLYGKQRYHIDTQGYRTWGVGFKSVSSPCLKTKSN